MQLPKIGEEALTTPIAVRTAMRWRGPRRRVEMRDGRIVGDSGS